MFAQNIPVLASRALHQAKKQPENIVLKNRQLVADCGLSWLAQPAPSVFRILYSAVAHIVTNSEQQCRTSSNGNKYM